MSWWDHPPNNGTVEVPNDTIDWANWALQDNQSSCDERLARLFGDSNVVVATATEPSTVDGNPNNGIRNRIGLVGEDPREGVMHIFSDINGSYQSNRPGFLGNLYAPAGYTQLFGKADPHLSGERPTKYSNIQVIYPQGSLSRLLLKMDFEFPLFTRGRYRRQAGFRFQLVPILQTMLDHI